VRARTGFAPDGAEGIGSMKNRMEIAIAAAAVLALGVAEANA
jgi:hypothetical protein